MINKSNVDDSVIHYVSNMIQSKTNTVIIPDTNFDTWSVCSFMLLGTGYYKPYGTVTYHRMEAFSRCQFGMNHK